jgi:thioredoxin-like negative regulator of GroEL
MVLSAGALCAAPGQRIAGSGFGGNSPYATDAYPGFDGLDDLPKPERREKSWFLHVARDTPAEQFAYAKELAENDDFKKACKMCDALVREWPASAEAPAAQRRLAELLLEKDDDAEGALEEYEDLVDG